MLGELLAHLKNYFIYEIHVNKFTITGGSITLPFVLPGQYFRIAGSKFNDGVYLYPAEGLKDETFNGAVWALAVPQEVVAISREIEAWKTAHGESPFVSESFGGYSYSRATGAGGAPITWQEAFRSRLNPWRKI